MNIFKNLSGDTYNLILYLNEKDKNTLKEFVNSSDLYVSPFIYILNQMPVGRSDNKEQFEQKINHIYSIFSSLGYSFENNLNIRKTKINDLVSLLENNNYLNTDFVFNQFKNLSIQDLKKIQDDYDIVNSIVKSNNINIFNYLVNNTDLLKSYSEYSINDLLSKNANNKMIEIYLNSVNSKNINEIASHKFKNIIENYTRTNDYHYPSLKVEILDFFSSELFKNSNLDNQEYMLKSLFSVDFSLFKSVIKHNKINIHSFKNPLWNVSSINSFDSLYYIFDNFKFNDSFIDLTYKNYLIDKIYPLYTSINSNNNLSTKFNSKLNEFLKDYWFNVLDNSTQENISGFLRESKKRFSTQQSLLDFDNLNINLDLNVNSDINLNSIFIVRDNQVQSFSLSSYLKIANLNDFILNHHTSFEKHHIKFFLLNFNYLSQNSKLTNESKECLFELIKNNMFSSDDLNDFKINDEINNNQSSLKKSISLNLKNLLIEKNNYLLELKSVIENQQLLQLTNNNNLYQKTKKL